MDDEINEGTGERGHFFWDPKKKKMSRKRPVEKVQVHGVIQDTIDPIESMATPHREIFESKSQYRRHLKAHGFEDVGKVSAELPSAARLREEEEREEKQRRDDIERAYQDIKNDRIEFTEQEKENHLREERKCRQNKIPTKLKSPY